MSTGRTNHEPRTSRLAASLSAAALVFSTLAVVPAFATHDAAADHPASGPRRLSPSVKLTLDRSGHRRVGKASFYARMFAGRKMADGTKMEPTGNNLPA